MTSHWWRPYLIWQLRNFWHAAGKALWWFFMSRYPLTEIVCRYGFVIADCHPRTDISCGSESSSKRSAHLQVSGSDRVRSVPTRDDGQHWCALCAGGSSLIPYSSDRICIDPTAGSVQSVHSIVYLRTLHPTGVLARLCNPARIHRSVISWMWHPSFKRFTATSEA